MPDVLPLVEAQIEAGELAMRDLVARLPYRVCKATARAAGCAPLANLNTPEEYGAALRCGIAAGLIDLSGIVPCGAAGGKRRPGGAGGTSGTSGSGAPLP
jgi:hypothetical protein